MSITVEFPTVGDHVPPTFVDGEWHDLPPLLDALKKAAKFTRPKNMVWSRDEAPLRHVHFGGGRLFASDNCKLIEIEVGDCDLPHVGLLPSDIALLASFGSDPTCAALSGERIAFRFQSGEHCEF